MEYIKFLKSKKILVLALGVVILLVVIILKFGFTANGQWQDYSSDLLGFSISHPAGWKVNEEVAGSGPDILVSEKNGFAFVRIRGLFDPYLSSTEAVQASITQYKKTLSLQEGVSLADFRREEVSGGVGGFYASGEFVINDTAYRYEERGRLSTQGRVLIMRAADAPASFENSMSVMQKIMNSFTLQ